MIVDAMKQTHFFSWGNEPQKEHFYPKFEIYFLYDH